MHSLAAAAAPFVVCQRCTNPAGKLFILRRRCLLSGISWIAVAAAAAAVPAALASEKRVRLQDVEQVKMRDAISAAVSGDFSSAEKLLTELIEEEEGSASAWSNRGNVRVSLGKYEDAVTDLSKAILLAPRAPVPRLNRAIALEALGRYEDAISDCKAAIQLDPEEYAAWYNLGNVEVRVEDYPSALDAYKKAAGLAPGIAGYRLKQALVLLQLDAEEDARRLMEGLVRKYPNYSEGRAALAAVLWSEGRRSLAEEQLNRATIQEPKLNDISWVRSKLEWPPKAVQAMVKLLGIDMQ